MSLPGANNTLPQQMNLCPTALSLDMAAKRKFTMQNNLDCSVMQGAQVGFELGYPTNTLLEN